jgi:hypothetical protein
MAARFSMHWAMPLEPGLSTHVSLVDYARDHQEWRGAGAELARLVGAECLTNGEARSVVVAGLFRGADTGIDSAAHVLTIP